MTSKAHTDDEPEEPKTTRVTFHNPDAGSPPAVYDGQEETAKEHFEAAQYLKRKIGSGRKQLFGEFAVAVCELDENGDIGPLLNLCNKIVDQNLSFRKGHPIMLQETAEQDIVYDSREN